MQILNLLWTINSIFLIIFIFLKVPEKDGVMQNIEFSQDILGSPKIKNKILENGLWILLFMFYFLSGLKTFISL